MNGRPYGLEGSHSSKQRRILKQCIMSDHTYRLLKSRANQTTVLSLDYVSSAIRNIINQDYQDTEGEWYLKKQLRVHSQWL